MAEKKTSGKCALCGKSFVYVGMAKHLEACLEAEAAKSDPGAKTTPAFHIQVRSSPPVYWLDLLVPKDRTLSLLDHFLRDIWLECCGHMSSFTISGRRFEIPSEYLEDEDMSRTRVGAVLRPGLTFAHEYDYGSTTELDLRVVGEHQTRGALKAVRLLARNDPPDCRCEVCGQAAEWICAQCLYQRDATYCRAHAGKHECGVEMLLPLVNSPRTGVCGYTGPEDPNREWPEEEDEPEGAPEPPST